MDQTDLPKKYPSVFGKPPGFWKHEDILHRKAFAAGETATFEKVAAGSGGHASPEAMLAGALYFFRLPGSLGHMIIISNFLKWLLINC